MGNNIAQGLYPLQRHHHHHHHPHHHRQQHHHRADDDGAASGAWAVIIMKHTTTLDCSTLRPKKGGCATPKQSAEHTKPPSTHSLSLSLSLTLSLFSSLSLLSCPFSLSLPCRSSRKKEQHELSLFCTRTKEIQERGENGAPSCGISFIVG